MQLHEGGGRIAAARERRAALARLGDRIARCGLHVSVATHRLLTLIREFDERGGWFEQGALSCAHWLSWRLGLGLVAAREKVRIAKALGTLGRIDAALKEGRISYAKVRALVRVATPENEEALLALALEATGSQLERLCRRYRSVGTPVAEPESFVSVRQLDHGMSRATLQAPTERIELLVKALDATVKVVHEDRRRRRAGRFRFRRIDAAIALAEATLSGGVSLPNVGKRPPRYEVMVLFDPAKRQAHLENGAALAMPTVERLACDAALVPVAWTEGKGALDVGRRTRAVPPAIERALRLRDRECRFPGCTHHLWTDAHHIRHWSKGGETKLSNLILLCDVHHRLVHEGGFAIAGDAAAPVFYDPDGRRLAPFLEPCVPDPQGDLDGWLAGEGLLTRELPIPGWDGTPLDHHLAISLLAEQNGPARGRAFTLGR